eukprot:scaffold300869_cov40-Prasinocladus_malaysianus.AAC.1
MHDDRGGGDRGQQRPNPRKPKAKLWEEDMGGKWLHDRFDRLDMDDDEQDYHQGGHSKGYGRGRGRGRGRAG